MTLTFNPDTYGSLLAQYRPKIIVSEIENDAAIAIAEELEHRSSRTPEEEALLELLVTLIEKFEGEHYPIPESSPLEILIHLMEARDCKQEDLIGVIGSRGVTSEVVNGKRSISKAQAKALADFFKVDAGLFI
jgi:HTH-type transcriptional regulator / antitoxin HigA